MTDSVLPAPDVTDLPTSIADAADAPVSETAERFLRAIVAEIPVERIEELHLFSPLRQGTVETGIAVLAARALMPVPVLEEPELALESAEAETDEAVTDEAVTEEPVAQETVPEEMVPEETVPEETVPVAELREPVERHTVYTARYRYVIKGPERGKWEADIKAEADAPLVTVETVVRGVQRRAGEDSEIVRYSSAQIARVLAR